MSVSTVLSKIKPYVRWLVSGVLLVILFQWIDFQALKPALSRLQLAPILMAFVIFVAERFFLAVRWKMVLQPYSTALRTATLIRITFVSTFIANFLPSALSSDVVRGYFLRKEDTDMSTVISSVFLDRVVGLGALLILSAVATSIAYTRGLLPSDWLVFVLVLLGVTVTGILIGISPWLGTLTGRMQESSFSIVQRLGKVAAAIHRYPWTLNRFLKIMGYSCFVYFLTIIANYLVFRAISSDVPLGYFFLFVLIVQLALSIPISVGGLGVHEGAWILVLGRVGVTPEVALLFALLLRTLSLLVSSPGGFLYALHTPRPSKAQPSETSAAFSNDSSSVPLDQTGIS